MQSMKTLKAMIDASETLTPDQPAQHTPGPWYVGNPIRSADCLGICHSHADDPEQLEETIAEVLPGGPPGNQEADARLIAAAPELLAALKRVRDRLLSHTASLESCDLPHGTELALEQAEEVIARATGGQP